MSDQQWIDGFIAIEATLRAESRDVAELVVDQARREGRIARLENLAAAAGVVVRHVPAGELTELGVSEVTSGGVAALVGPRRFQSPESLITPEKSPAIVMLDGVEDPFNFGQAVRALYAAGIDGLVLRPRNWLSAAATVARASAGASELMPMAVAESAEQALDFFRGRGLLVACADIEDSTPMTDVDLTRPLFLIVGGEKRGISRAVLRAADVRIHIPYGRAIDYALGTATAAAVLGFEVARQRRARPALS